MTDFSDLAISLDQVCFLVVKARQLGAKDVVTEADPGSNPADDGAAAVLEDHGNDPARSEIVGFVQALNVDERLDLVTLATLGRDDLSLEEWSATRSEAAQALGNSILAELTETPLLSDYLEEALAKFGVSCMGIEAERL